LPGLFLKAIRLFLIGATVLEKEQAFHAIP
jgi:hypothetical protein